MQKAWLPRYPPCIERRQMSAQAVPCDLQGPPSASLPKHVALTPLRSLTQLTVGWRGAVSTRPCAISSLRYQILAWRGGTASPGPTTSVVMDSVARLPTCHRRGSSRRSGSLTLNTMSTGDSPYILNIITVLYSFQSLTLNSMSTGDSPYFHTY